jgi:hypothetical protein
MRPTAPLESVARASLPRAAAEPSNQARGSESAPAASTVAAPPIASEGESAGVLPARRPLGSTPGATASGERATLVLLGDGTVVSVDGVSRGPAPARVAVEPGTHAVLFSFPATGESRAESITLRPAERATVRADFTSVKPTVRVLK